VGQINERRAPGGQGHEFAITYGAPCYGHVSAWHRGAGAGPSRAQEVLHRAWRTPSAGSSPRTAPPRRQVRWAESACRAILGWGEEVPALAVSLPGPPDPVCTSHDAGQYRPLSSHRSARAVRYVDVCWRC